MPPDLRENPDTIVPDTLAKTDAPCMPTEKVVPMMPSDAIVLETLAKTDAPCMPTEKVTPTTPPEKAIPEKPPDTIVQETPPDPRENTDTIVLETLVKTNAPVCLQSRSPP